MLVTRLLCIIGELIMLPLLAVAPIWAAFCNKAVADNEAEAEAAADCCKLLLLLSKMLAAAIVLKGFGGIGMSS